VTAVQTEYSLWTRGVESGVLPTCRALGIGLVAYSPLGALAVHLESDDLVELNRALNTIAVLGKV